MACCHAPRSPWSSMLRQLELFLTWIIPIQPIALTKPFLTMSVNDIFFYCKTFMLILMVVPFVSVIITLQEKSFKGLIMIVATLWLNRHESEIRNGYCDAIMGYCKCWQVSQVALGGYQIPDRSGTALLAWLNNDMNNKAFPAARDLLK